MRVLLLGASGMVGQGVLRECLADERVGEVLVVGRTELTTTHPELAQVVLADLLELGTLADRLTDVDACLFCVGVSAGGMSEARYRALTFDLTLSVARVVAAAAPGAVFVYVSGAGTDDTGRSRMMWARVKGATENALGELDLRTYFLRPGWIQPRHGVTSRTRRYALLYRVAGPLYPLLRRLAPGQVTTTEAVGRAMVAVAADGWPEQVLTSAAINAAAARRA